MEHQLDWALAACARILRPVVRLALAMGAEGSTFSDHGMRWDNSRRNGHYAPINWSGQQ